MDIIVPTKKINIALDATLLSSIMNCGRFTDLRFNHYYELASGKSNSLEVGSLVHKVLETRDKLVIGGMGKSEANNYGLIAGQLYATGCPYCLNFEPIHSNNTEALDPETSLHTQKQDVGHICDDKCITKPECGHERNEYPGVKNSPEENDKHYIGWKWALETMVQYFEYYKNDFWVPLEVEVVKGKIFFEDDNIRILFKSKFDLLVDTQQGVNSMDHKTMKQNRDILSLNNQFKGQAINSNSRQVWINKIGFQKTLPPKEKFIRTPVSYSLDSLNEFQSEIVPYWAYKMLEYQETGYWPPNYSNCDGKFGKCIYHEVCEADRNMRSEIIKINFIVGEPWNPVNVKTDE
jgi:hypothetical protein